MEKTIFERKSKIDAPVEEVFKWHARPGAIERYSPPWDPISVVEKTGGIESGAEVKLKMKAGPVSYLWHARHTDYIENRLFRDEQVRGPFSKWIHTHEFEPIDENSCFIRDSIEYKLPPHPMRNRISNQMVRNKLSAIFSYRHRVLAQDLAQQMSAKDRSAKTIAVTGSSGVLASALIPFLTTAGHRVIKLVRRKEGLKTDEIFWDPAEGKIDAERLEEADVIIHLAGEHIGKGRWTKEKKKRILSSRVLSTRLLVDTITQYEKYPETFISASAIGYYGDRGDTELFETDKPGDDFISMVCRNWEEEAAPARKAGIRTVNLRIGVVLDPLGGALAQLLPSFKLGIGTRIASGRQYVSWIGLNDVVGAIYHIMHHTNIKGAVNMVSPNPCTNEELSRTLANVLSSKRIATVSAPLIKTVFGEMGKEILLSSARVMPGILKQTGYTYRYAQLNDLLKHVLGKEN